MNAFPVVTLNDGHQLPEVGFGTWKLRGEEGVAAINSAIESGYRLLDTAVNYENEHEVGEAMRRSGVTRNELFVTSKIPGRHHGRSSAVSSIEGSLAALGLDQIDLHLIHWPNPKTGRWIETWLGMIDAQRAGLVRSIGVANFTEPMLARLIEETGVTPAVNQVEIHPYFPQGRLLRFHRAHDIRTQSWSPLGSGESALLEEPTIVDLATRYRVEPAQIVLRWHVQRRSTPIPRSSSAEHQRQNTDIFAFQLLDDEVTTISKLERGRLFDTDPDHYEGR